MRVALATSAGWPALYPDDVPLRDALIARGVDARAQVWDRTAPWGSFDLVVVRSTWDYHLRLRQYLDWAERVPRLANPADVLRWNTDKTYLRELAEADIATVPTIWVDAGRTYDLTHLPWKDAVIKPAVSAGARNTLRFRTDDVAPAAEMLRRICASGTAMLQPYLRSVEDHGERSLTFIDGQCTHAVRREPALAGGSTDNAVPVDVADDERAMAHDVLAATPGDLLYARVDLVRDDAGALQLIELEVTEPQLFLRHSSEATELLADAIVRRAGGADSGDRSTTSGS